MQAYKTLDEYRKAKIAVTETKKAANEVIAAEGRHNLPKHCDREAIRATFTSLAKTNKNARAILEDLNGAAIFAEAEAKRVEKRAAKMKAEHDALENAINSRLDEILADDQRRALLILEANAAAELAAQAAQSGDVENVA